MTSTNFAVPNERGADTRVASPAAGLGTGDAQVVQMPSLNEAKQVEVQAGLSAALSMEQPEKVDHTIKPNQNLKCTQILNILYLDFKHSSLA